MPYVIQRALALALLLVLGPLIVALAIAVRLTSRGPAFHRATRVRPGGTFTLYKLRSMRVGADTAGPGITARGDPRVTRLGRVLRRTKLDELPQLWNVVRGEMALAGPRPEDPRYVDMADPLHVRVYGALPGITSPTALAYRNEEAIVTETARELARAHGRSDTTGEDVDRAYREVVQPAKLAMDAEYLATRSTRTDIAVLGMTIGQVLRRTGRP
jgi:lipopolysaccharide/colanic/teichoic acid biosynthesis glycosyltransferase